MRLVKKFVALLSLWIVGVVVAEGQELSAPDFAFPVKVRSEALSSLLNVDALPPERLDAAIRYALANTSISPDSISVTLKVISEVEQSNNATALGHLLDLLQAQIYYRVYDRSRYRINRRETIAATDDIELWSKRQFMERVDSLLQHALSDKELLMSIPLEQWCGPIVCPKGKEVMAYPTLYDFVAYSAIDLLQGFERGTMGILNRDLAEHPLDDTIYPAEVTFPGKILRIYYSLIEGRDESLAAVLALRNMIEYVVENEFDGELPVVSFEQRLPENRRYKALLSAYEQRMAQPYAVELLLNVSDSGLSLTERTRLYALLSDFRQSNPHYFNIQSVDYALSQLSTKRVSVSFPSQVSNGMTAQLSVSSINGADVRLRIYDVSQVQGRQLVSKLVADKERFPVVFDETIHFAQSVPFDVDTVVPFSVPRYGRYAVVAQCDDTDDGSRYAEELVCSDMSLAFFGGIGENYAAVSDAVTGHACSDVEILYYPWSRKTDSSTSQGITDKSGFLKLSADNSGELFCRRDGDRFARRVNFYPVNKREVRMQHHARVMSGIALYRPGDKANFALIAYETEGQEQRLDRHARLSVRLRDVNYQLVDSVGVVTDEWGRAEFDFQLPEDCLTGNFSVEVYRGKRLIGNYSIEVSDYKLPTFEVVVDSIPQRGYLDEPVVIMGYAAAYSGFPLSDAKVNVALKVRSGFWRWSSLSPVFYTIETTTDSVGAFKVVIPAKVFNGSPAPRGYFQSTISVTSPAGETREGHYDFNRGFTGIVELTVPEVFTVGKQNKCSVQLRNSSGNVVDMPILLRVARQDDSGSFKEVSVKHISGGELQRVVAKLSPGCYKMIVSPADSTFAAAVMSQEFVVYNPQSRDCPVDAMLWLPSRQVEIDSVGAVKVVLGTVLEKANLIVAVADEDGYLLSHRRVEISRGMNSVDLQLPSNKKEGRAYFWTVNGCKSASLSVDLIPAAERPGIALEISFLRNHVLPGAQEKVCIQVKGSGGASTLSAVMADMSNRAIDDLRPLNFAFNPVDYRGIRGLSLDGFTFDSCSLWLSQRLNRLSDALEFGAPTFNFYGESLLGVRYGMMDNGIMIRGSKKMARGSSINDDAVAEESVTYAAADMASPAVSGGSDDIEENAEPAESYRPSEIALSFFRPMLMTSDDGSLTLEYVVPDANTSWILRVLAYNDGLLSARNSAEIVSAKPLMVSANRPRFVRSGDDIKLMASVMNLSSDRLAVTADINVTDVDGRQLSYISVVDTISANHHFTPALGVHVPDTLSALVVTVKAKGGTFTDGERFLIPILPSSQDVVASDQFFVAADDAHFALDLEPVTDGRAYLSYCDNPALEAVKALPALYEPKIGSSIEYASAMFAAAVSRGLIKGNPELLRIINRWISNPSDSALVSPLMNDEMLKSIALSSTPWVADALDENEQMARLSLLLNSREVNDAIARALRGLKKCVTPEGAFCWTPSFKYPSQWATGAVLEQFAILAWMGWPIEDKATNKMVEDAMGWLDKEVLKQAKEHRDADLRHWCLLRLMLPKVARSSAVTRVINEQVQRTISGWRHHDVINKALDARLLFLAGYHATAKSIVGSLTEFSTYSPQRGRWWAQLIDGQTAVGKVDAMSRIFEAFQMVSPAAAETSQIKQWLLLNKQSNNWGGTAATSRIVGSILKDGHDILPQSVFTVMRVGDELLSVPPSLSAVGSFTLDITKYLSHHTSLSIDRQSTLPSVGAIVTMQTLPTDSIKSQSCADLSVEKSYGVLDDDHKVRASNTFAVGDKVIITYVIRANADMSYLALSDSRPATLEPVEQLPGEMWVDGIRFYRENRDSATNIFIDYLPKGVYQINVEMYVSASGMFNSGAVQVWSEYNPSIQAHSAGSRITVE